MIVESLIQGNQVWNIVSIGLSLLVVIAIAMKLIGFVKTYNFYTTLAGSSDRSLLYGHLHKIPSSGEGRVAFGTNRMLEPGRGRFGCVWLGPFKPLLNVYHPELVKKIVTSSAPKSRSAGSPYDLALPWIGEGLIVANGHRWARSRRLLTPAFHFDILKDYMHVFNEGADKLIKKLDKLAETGECFDICPLLTLCTLEVILKCSLGFESDIQETGHPYAQANRDLTEIWSHRMRKPWLWSDFIFRLTAEGKTFFKHCDYVHKVAEDIIEKRKEEMSQGKVNKSRKLDFIDILLSARDEEGKPMTTLEMRNEVDTFMFAGHDTTATAVPWFLYTLAKHSEYMKMVQEEVDNIMEGRDNPDISWQDLSKLEMLSLCNKETFRLFPTVPFIQRELHEDIDFDGTNIPAGTTVTIPIIFLHRNPLVWDNPDEFRPERFRRENKTSLDPFAFMPFSAGARYNVKLAPNAEPPRRLPAGVLKTENGIWLTLQRR